MKKLYRFKEDGVAVGNPVSMSAEEARKENKILNKLPDSIAISRKFERVFSRSQKVKENQCSERTGE